MSNQKAFLRTKSKNELIRIIQQLQVGLSFYGNESNWAVRDDLDKEGLIVWLGDDDPTEVAQILLGQRKAKTKIVIRNGVREPDNIISAIATTKKKMEDIK